MKAVPGHLLVTGGGPVGVEMTQVVRSLGGDVTLVEAAGHVLPAEPAPLGDALIFTVAPQGRAWSHVLAAQREDRRGENAAVQGVFRAGRS